MIKKISIRKMIGLQIITLGTYSIFWLAQRRNEIVSTYKLPLPHWLWLVLPPLAGTLLVFLIPTITFAYGQTLQDLIALITVLLILLMLTVAAIYCWWMIRFGQAVAKITEGRIPLGWTLVFWIILNNGVIFVHQYYFNRMPHKTALSTRHHTPTKKFIVTSGVILIVASIMIVVGSIALVNYLNNSSDWSATESEAREIDHKAAEANRLLNKYNECIKRLDEQYPGELMIEEVTAYNEAYAICEEIRLLQHAAVDEYNKALQNW